MENQFHFKLIKFYMTWNLLMHDISEAQPAVNCITNNLSEYMLKFHKISKKQKNVFNE